MKNEPVVQFGWFWFESEENKSPYTQITGYTYERFSTMKPDGSAKIDEGSLIPLYTHPVKELTLTEDEIDDVWASCSTGESEFIDMHLFAEAILRKASEKC